MRLSQSFVVLGLLLVLNSPAQPQSRIDALTLGFVPNEAGTNIFPVIGVRGASVLGQRLELGVEIHHAVVSPRQDFALAVGSEDGSILVIDLHSEPSSVSAIEGFQGRADLIALSPTGRAAVIYDNESKAIQVITGLPAGAIAGTFDAQTLGTGQSIAVSDDGNVVILKTVSDDVSSLWVLSSANQPQFLSMGQPGNVAFLPNVHDAVVTDGPNGVVIRDIENSATRYPFGIGVGGVEGFSSVGTSADSQTAFLADAKTGVVALVDLGTYAVTLLDCQCHPTGLNSLRSSVVRLTNQGSDAVIVVDTSEDGPRTLIVPPQLSLNEEGPRTLIVPPQLPPNEVVQ
jgi:hypothetical protein